MFDKVLVGYDGTQRSDDALVLASLLARLGGGRVTAACAYWFLRLGPARAQGGPDMTAEDAERAVSTIAERFGEEVDVRRLASPSAARALHELAEAEQYDLIVVGSTSRGKIGRTLVGTTADRLLHGAPCPVALAPLGYRDSAPGTFGRIGAAFCADPEALSALHVAARIATAAGATVDVIGAFEGPAVERFRYGPLGAGEVVVDARASAEADLEDAARTLHPALAVCTHLVGGHPAAVLTEQSAELDLLVMGSRAYGPLGRALLGSVSQAVMLRSSAPVLVVARGIAERSRAPAEWAVAST